MIAIADTGSDVDWKVTLVFVLAGLFVWLAVLIREARKIRHTTEQEIPHPQGTCTTKGCPNDAVVRYRGPRCEDCGDRLARLDHERIA